MRVAARRSCWSEPRVNSSTVTRWRRFLTRRRNSLLVSRSLTADITSAFLENDLRPSVAAPPRRVSIRMPRQLPTAVGGQLSFTRAYRRLPTRTELPAIVGSPSLGGGDGRGFWYRPGPVYLSRY